MPHINRALTTRRRRSTGNTALLGGEAPMLTSSRYLVNSSPRCCMFCREPFRPRDGYIEFWRTSAGQHFCSEFCADDAEEAQFRKRRAAAQPGLVAGAPHL